MSITLTTSADLDLVQVQAGGFLAFRPASYLTITANDFQFLSGSIAGLSQAVYLVGATLTVAAGATINGNGGGFGPGAGPQPGGQPGGAGHGGNGGTSSAGGVYGFTYDDRYLPTQAGSGGGPGQFVVGGSGGAALMVAVSYTAKIDGVIDVSGTQGQDHNFVSIAMGGGGGSGGTLQVEAGILSGSGSVLAAGGRGGNATGGSFNYGGGGGGGGRVALCGLSGAFAGTVSVAGGAGGGPASFPGISGTVEACVPTPMDIALDIPGYLVVQSTAYPNNWQGQTITANYGGSAVKSGPIGNNQTSNFYLDVTGPACVSFEWKVSSESGYDILWYRNGTTFYQPGISGNQGWATVTDVIGAGTTRMSWWYAKDGATVAGQDAGWVDHVVIVAGAPTASCTASASPTPTPTPSPTLTRTPTALPTGSLTVSFTRTLTPSSTRSPTWTPSPSLSATLTLSMTPTSTASRTPTLVGTCTSTPTATASASQTGSPTQSPTATQTPTVTQSFTVSPTFSLSPTFSVSPTVTMTPIFPALAASAGDAPHFGPVPQIAGGPLCLYSKQPLVRVAATIYNHALETCQRLDLQGQSWPCWTLPSGMASGVYILVGEVEDAGGKVWPIRQKLVVFVSK